DGHARPVGVVLRVQRALARRGRMGAASEARSDPVLRRRALGAAVLLALGVHALTKGPGRIAEMLWACHVASALIGVGLLTGRRAAYATGTLFLVSMGLPAYAIDLLAGARTTVTAVVAHAVPIVAGV